MKSAEFIGHAAYQGKLYNIGAYPGVVPSNQPSDRVQGEVYRLLMPTLTLQRLDRYEECGAGFPKPAEYVRKIQPVQLMNDEIISAWIYLYNRPVRGRQRLPSGDFMNDATPTRHSMIVNLNLTW